MKTVVSAKSGDRRGGSGAYGNGGQRGQRRDRRRFFSRTFSALPSLVEWIM